MRTDKEKRAARVALRDQRDQSETAIDGAAAALARVVCPDADELRAGMDGWSLSMRIRAGVATDAELRLADAAGELLKALKGIIDYADRDIGEVEDLTRLGDDRSELEEALGALAFAYAAIARAGGAA